MTPETQKPPVFVEITSNKLKGPTDAEVAIYREVYVEADKRTSVANLWPLNQSRKK